MGRNKTSSENAASAGRCYLCETRPATVADGIGSKICAPCSQELADLRKQYALRDGYRPRSTPPGKFM